MGRNARARRLATYAAYGGGVLALAGMAFAGLLVSQVILVHRAIPRGVLNTPRSTGTYGAHRSGKPLTFAMLGDSSAVGQGADSPEETPGGRLAVALSSALDRPVDLICVAKVSAQSMHLPEQVESLRDNKPDVAVIMVGANDIVRRANMASAIQNLSKTVQTLHAWGTKVVVGTCPDIGSIEPLRQPLRWLTQRWCRDLAAAQTIAVVGSGGRTVSLGDLLSEPFSQHRNELFSIDHFHPSADGYALVAEVLLPSIMAAIGEEITNPSGYEPTDAHALPRQGTRQLALAAAEAATTPGTEVAPATQTARNGGRLWGVLRNRLAEWVGQ